MVGASPVDLIKSKTDLVQLVSGHVQGLKKSGRNWSACCPFHAEKTPSFILWPDEGRWKCFGCGLGGDVFAFVMRAENLDFPAALKQLAEKAGLQLEDRPRRPEETVRRRRLLDLNAAASLWFHSLLLQDPRAAHAREFVERRHLSHQTVLDFQLGYAPDSWDALRTHLTGLGYSPDEQLAAGVLHESEKSQPYDRFRNRLIYPIRDAGGHIVAFGGRELGQDKKGAKFINSPQTDIFDKSATLYGLDRAKNDIRTRDQVIVVEGYMDAIMCHQCGETNAVCSMGTSLTERQLEQIKRLTTNLVLCLDPDLAGDLATERGVDVGRQVFDRELVPVPSVGGFVRLEARLKADIRIMSLPRGQDPDEVIYADKELWRKQVEAALPLLEYKFQQIVARHDVANARDKLALVDDLGGELALIPDRIQRHHYLGKLRDHLSGLATPFRIGEAELNEAVTRAMQRRRAAQRSQPAADARVDALGSRSADGRRPLRLDTEDFLVMRALRYPPEAWRDVLHPDEIAKSENREVLRYLLEPSQQPSELIVEHMDMLRELGAREPEIPEQQLGREFEALALKLREETTRRKLLERAAILDEDPDRDLSQIQAAALEDVAALHLTKTELSRRTLLAQAS